MKLIISLFIFSLLFVTQILAFSETEICGTELVWEKFKKQNSTFSLKSLKSSPMATCNELGACDNPDHRNSFSGLSINVKVAVIVIGTQNGITAAVIDEQMETLNTDWNFAGVSFSLSHTAYHNINGQQCVASFDSPLWYNQIQNFKAASQCVSVSLCVCVYLCMCMCLLVCLSLNVFVSVSVSVSISV